MAETGIFCSGAHVLRKAGEFASATASTEAYYNDFISQAESFINDYTRYNWSDAYSSLNVDKKELLKEIASNLAAIYIINYDMTGSTLSHFQTQLNILWNRALAGLDVLKQQENREFIQSA